MPLATDQKAGLIQKFHRSEADTGSPEVQVAIITERIKQISQHLDAHKRDHHSRRGLLMLVGQRRRLLKYLSREDFGRYQQLIAELGLRR